MIGWVDSRMDVWFKGLLMWVYRRIGGWMYSGWLRESEEIVVLRLGWIDGLNCVDGCAVRA